MDGDFLAPVLAGTGCIALGALPFFFRAPIVQLGLSMQRRSQMPRQMRARGYRSGPDRVDCRPQHLDSPERMAYLPP